MAYIEQLQKVYSYSMRIGNTIVVDFLNQNVSTQMYPNRMNNSVDINSAGKNEIINIKIGHKKCSFTVEELYEIAEKRKEMPKKNFWSLFKK